MDSGEGATLQDQGMHVWLIMLAAYFDLPISPSLSVELISEDGGGVATRANAERQISLVFLSSAS